MKGQGELRKCQTRAHSDYIADVSGDHTCHLSSKPRQLVKVKEGTIKNRAGTSLQESGPRKFTYVKEMSMQV